MPPTLGKRLFSQAVPEPIAEPLPAQAIVVIHPGSYWLRIGRASDSYPHAVPHCIARRHKQPGIQERYADPWLVRPECRHTESKSLQKTGLRLAEEAIRCRPTTSGEYRQNTTQKQMYQLNSQVVAESTDIPSPMNWTNTHLKPEHILSDEALYLHPSDCYNLHWPIRRGRLNIHEGPGGTLSAVLQDLEVIWASAIQLQLEIPLKDLKHYRAVLLIPDVYDRHHVREMMNVILNRLGFSAAIVVQESVCATFGAGVGSACVIDIGDQKTSVSCVEDGLSQINSRLVMDYGGSDVTRCFHWLLMKTGFPYKECDISSQVDAMFMQDLKETLCHLEHDISGIGDQMIQVKTPGQNIVKYNMHIGDEVVLAPMSLFYPDMFGLLSETLYHTHLKSPGDPEDPHDEIYLRQTQSRQEQAAKLVAARRKENAEAKNEAKDVPETLMDDSVMDDEDTNDPPDTMGGDASGSGVTKSNRKAEEEENRIVLGRNLIGIDQAILQSIDKCDSDDMKKRMYGTIVVVGGGASLFRGAEGWIKYAVWTQMPPQFRVQLETMDVIVEPKEYDPRLACWKGGTIMCSLDTAQELWIRQREWRKYGVRLLRERAPFVW